ncbi:MAG: imidazolonepropionase [Ignavibacteria bacterium]|nr:imidazolonepropionase [Ignavibacteria bacterium]
MRILAKDISSLVTVSGENNKPRKGKLLNEIGEIKNGALYFDEKILWVGTTTEAEIKLQNGEIKPDKIVSLKNKTILPGFVDSHTHLVFAGDRSEEFSKRIAGATYQQIANEGGGIISTVTAVRNSTENELFENSCKYLESAIRYGTIAFEIKSGYGLDTKNEIKMLKVIERLSKEFPVYIVPTFLGAHDIPPEYKFYPDEYIKLICDEMLPRVSELGLAKYCDCFVDKGYYTIEQAKKIFDTALKFGLKIRMHADELADVGAAEFAATIGAVSADHLLFVSDKSIQALKNSATIATLLPGTSYFIRMPYAPAKKLIENDIPIALATDFNPGSCFTENMQIILSLAVINLGLNCEQAIVASTINGAHSLELNDKIGSLEIGKDATFIVFDCKNYLEIFYHFGVNNVEMVWINGKRFW